uniref:Uncharacterized protein n=1 Tax=Arundo donax TaxID=35708 RepID=A0A0A9C479_ARUDO
MSFECSSKQESFGHLTGQVSVKY